MSQASDYLENKLIDSLFRNQTALQPATLYIALFTAAPSDSGGGTEVSTNNYARAAVTSALANWAATQGGTTASTGTGGLTSNLGVITFNVPSSTGWGVVTHFGIFDASTTGNLLIWGALTASKTINGGDTVTFPIGTLTVTVA